MGGAGLTKTSLPAVPVRQQEEAQDGGVGDLVVIHREEEGDKCYLPQRTSACRPCEAAGRGVVWWCRGFCSRTSCRGAAGRSGTA